ncbi:MAG: plasmid pRiA4b ORF-3 family protein [Woeseiaceae bacterium]
MPNTAHRFYIELEGINPPIWRRIRVPGNYTFWDLHVAIQDAMGGLDYHLHLFHVRNPGAGALEQIGIPDDEAYLDKSPCLAGWEVPIARYFAKEGNAASCEYDFGDDWRHTVALEGVDQIRKGERRLACLGGERRCPPEDCGGIHGYAELLEVIADVKHPEHEALLQWLGGAYDPEAFSVSDVKFDDPKVRWRQAFLD